MNPFRSIVLNTPLEKPARAVLRMLRRSRSSESRSGWQIRAQRDEAATARLLRERLSPRSNCIDVGAHQGAFLRQFLHYSPDGHHVAFEPLPHLAEALRHRYSKVEVHACALGDQTGRVSFCHAVNRAGWSGLRTQPYPANTTVETIDVELRRLDDQVSSDRPTAFIKVDVEGAELEVFRGARATIMRHRPWVLFEHARVHNSEYGTTPEMVYNLLVDEYGLELRCLDGTGPLTRKDFRRIYDDSFASSYDGRAQTNFVAGPQQ